MEKKYSHLELLSLLQDIGAGYQPTIVEDQALKKVRGLDLRGAPITILPESIGLLANLQTLDLSDTLITTLPESIGLLTNLQTLDLSGTAITTLPESIGQLAKLQSLDLSNTQVFYLPESVAQLTNLQNFNLGGTQITALPEFICQLANLQSLNLRSSQITSLPETIWRLTDLQVLNVERTQITALPESVGQLSNLLILDLGGTRITTLPDSLGRLSNLFILDLSGTRISKLPDSFAQLVNLHELYLKDTLITALPDWLGTIYTLQYLDLQRLTLRGIPESLAMRKIPFVHRLDFDPSMSGINLYDTTLAEQSISIFLEQPELIPSLYQKTLLPVQECRMIFLGDGESGKTYTIKRFRNEGRKETEEKLYGTSETPGVEILNYPVGEGTESFTIHFWDFGGQQLLHSMHRCFLTDDTCYVVMVKTRETKANERARFWLRNVTAFAPQSPILLFVNCWEFDDGRRSIDEPGLRREFPMIQKVVYCSAKQADDVEFRECVMDPIIAMAAASNGICKRVPRQWVLVRQAIEEESEENNYLNKARYHELCERYGIENEHAPELLSLFNSLGVCFSYHRDMEHRELAEYKLLRPVWLTNAIYALIKEGRVHAREGRISGDQIERMLCNPSPKAVDGKPYHRTAPELEYKEDECPFILDIAVVNELCYPVDKNTFFFPALCGTDSPEEALTVPDSFGQHVSYLLRYQYLPDNVLHRLMIRCLRSGLPVEKCWLRGMVLYGWEPDRVLRIVVRMDDDERLQIDIWSVGNHKAYELFWVLRGQIQEINRQMRLCAEEYILDGEADFSLEDVLDAAETNSEVRRKGVRRNARELLGDFFDESIYLSLRVVNGVIIIPTEKKIFTSCKQNNKALRRALFDTYNQICPYCGNPMTYREMEVDHILPKHFSAPLILKPYLEYLKSCGFEIDEPDYVENFFPAHGHCNRDKSNRISEFSLPYWHEIAAQHAPRVLQLMEQYKGKGQFADDE